MKAMVCEMCGSNNLVKQDGMFVCQNCNTKYSVEEAKKLLDTVKIDHTDSIENYMTIAKNAYASSNNKEAEEYCNKIIEIEPTHSEAWLLKGISSAWQSTGAKIRMEEFITCVENAINNAKTIEELDSLSDRAYREYYSLTLAINKLKVDAIESYSDKFGNWKEYIGFPVTFLMWGMQIQIAYGTKYKSFYADKPESESVKPRTLGKEEGLDDLSEKCTAYLIEGGIKIWNKSLKDYQSSNDGYPTDYALDEMNKNATVAMLMLNYAVPSDTSKIIDKDKPNIKKACQNLITMKTVWMGLKSYSISFSGGVETHPVSKGVTLESKKEATEDIRRYHNIIKICDPSYVVPVVAEPTSDPAKSGCYVATAVYGSYDCPQVWTLRRYRDYTLAETWHGRAFIRTYYAISPTLVKWFGKTNWFRNMWKPKLDKMVEKLNNEGVSDTPYNDRNW